MKVTNAKDAVAIAESRFPGLKHQMILDYDDDHYVISLCPKDLLKGDEGLFAGVDKNTGKITRFYPNADFAAFRDAINNREVRLV